jgi:uncharacterized protein YndB with AHSA1/START domain
MTVPTDVDRTAPLIAHHEIDIEAPPDKVWNLHTDVNSWPTWQTAITAAHLDGMLEPGASFEWTSYDFTVTSTVYELASTSRVLWGGTSGGITGVHEWLFTGSPSGVHVATTESFAGEPVMADVRGMQTVLDTSLVTWLDSLKKAAERLGPE